MQLWCALSKSIAHLPLKEMSSVIWFYRVVSIDRAWARHRGKAAIWVTRRPNATSFTPLPGKSLLLIVDRLQLCSLHKTSTKRNGKKVDDNNNLRFYFVNFAISSGTRTLSRTHTRVTLHWPARTRRSNWLCKEESFIRRRACWRGLRGSGPGQTRVQPSEAVTVRHVCCCLFSQSVSFFCLFEKF